MMREKKLNAKFLLPDERSERLINEFPDEAFEIFMDNPDFFLSRAEVVDEKELKIKRGSDVTVQEAFENLLKKLGNPKNCKIEF